jgi:molybdate transport system permease protein
MNGPRLRPLTGHIFLAATIVLGLALGAFIGLPLLALFTQGGPGALLRGLRHPITLPALCLSLTTTLLSLAIVLLAGTPLAWHLARARRARWLESVLQLPMVMPPSVAGIVLLLAFGRRGLLGQPLESLGWLPTFSTAAVVMAQVFVAAPFYLQAALVAFRHLDPGALAVARSLGASPPRLFFQVVLPMARPALLAGAATAWARALGEFGATLMFAGNIGGRTQTLPLAIYATLESDLDATQALSMVLVVVAFALLLVVRRQGALAGGKP